MNIEQEKKLRELVRVFLEENKKLNLSAYRTEESCWIGNILDSLAFLDLLSQMMIKRCHPEPDEGRHRVMVRRAHHDTRYPSILDIGTGGGFPLLPLAICLPEIHFTGIDSTKKKINAVERITQTMGIPNVTLIWGRAEEHTSQYDIVLVRAIAPLPKLLPLVAPLTKTNGHMVLWKSMNIENELKESEPIQKKLGFTLIQQHVYELPGDWGKRQLIVFSC